MRNIGNEIYTKVKVFHESIKQKGTPQIDLQIAELQNQCRLNKTFNLKASLMLP